MPQSSICRLGGAGGVLSRLMHMAMGKRHQFFIWSCLRQGRLNGKREGEGESERRERERNTPNKSYNVFYNLNLTLKTAFILSALFCRSQRLASMQCGALMPGGGRLPGSHFQGSLPPLCTPRGAKQ